MASNFAKLYEEDPLEATRLLDEIDDPLVVKSYVSHLTQCGGTVLRLAVSRRDIPFIEKVVNLGVNLYPSRHMPATPFDLAIEREDIEIAKLLLKTGGEGMISTRHIEHAILRGNGDLFNLLIEQIGAYPPQVESYNVRGGALKYKPYQSRISVCLLCASIETAVAYRYPWALEILLSKECKICRRSLHKMMMLCLMGYHHTKFRILANPDAEEYASNLKRCIEILLSHGANPISECKVLEPSVWSNDRFHICALSVALVCRGDEIVPTPADVFDSILQKVETHHTKELEYEGRHILLQAYKSGNIDAFRRIARHVNPIAIESMLRKSISRNIFLYPHPICLEMIDIMLIHGVMNTMMHRDNHISTQMPLWMKKHVSTFHERVTLFEIIKLKLY